MSNKIWHTSWPNGLPKSLEYPKVPVWLVLKSTAQKYPDKEAFVFAGHGLTYSQLWEKACRFANALKDLGIEKGDVVAFYTPNLPQFVVAYYGVLLIGAVFSPCSPLLTPEELKKQLNDCKAKVLFAFNFFGSNVEKIRSETQLKHVILTGLEESESPFVPIEAPEGCLSFGR